MKKRFLVVSGLVIALIGVISCGFFCSALNTSLTDTVSVTIESNCTLEYDSENPHNSGTKKGTWDENALSVTMENGSVDTNIGSTNFNAICNDAGGYSVSLDIAALQSSDDMIAFSDSEPNANASSWGVWNGTKWVGDGDIVAEGEGATAGTNFSVTYGVGIDGTQSAGTYSGSATYTLTHPATEASDYYTLTFEIDDGSSEEGAILSTNSYKILKGNDGENGTEGTEIYLNPNSIEISGEKTLVEAAIRDGYYAHGWYIGDEQYSYNFYTITADTTFRLIVDTDGGCIAAGSKISMADGTEKNVENVHAGDEVLSYSNKTGTIVSSKVVAVWSDRGFADVFDVQLENGDNIKVVFHEYMFDVDAKEWLIIDRDSYQSAVGKSVMVNDGGNIGVSKIVAIDYTREETEHYTLYTDGTLDYIANNIVMMFPFYFANLRYTIGDDYKIDADEYNMNVAQYGLYTYDDFKDVCTKAIFDSLGLKDLKHVVDKGYITFEELAQGVKDLQAEIDYYNSL